MSNPDPVSSVDIVEVGKATRFKPGKHAAETGRKGGLVQSMRKKYAAKIREMQKEGMSEKQIDWFMQRIIDPEANMIQLEKVLDASKDTIDKDKYVSLSNQLHKTRFGEKRLNTNINVNVEVTPEQIAEHISKF